MIRLLAAAGCVAVWGPVLAAAESIAELSALHLAATGGAERVAALRAMRATGEVEAAGKRLRFVLLAARPDSVRLETEDEGRSLVQGTNGAEPPWEADLSSTPPRSSAMPVAAAKVFAADAEFDDPLIAGEARGYMIEEAGHAEIDGARLTRLLVTRRWTESFWLLIDPKTYLIVRRVEHRATALGRRVEVVTHYGDFRPVDGVLHAHRIEVVVDGKRSQLTRIERIESNPVIEAGVFRRPLVADKK
ncbi:MAG: hypothetical protein JNK23_01610 [Opitutaceae bacterium]|nr:hypothetical protein [Opitutaceae bacterium]